MPCHKFTRLMKMFLTALRGITRLFWPSAQCKDMERCTDIRHKYTEALEIGLSGSDGKAEAIIAKRVADSRGFGRLAFWGGD